MPVAQESAEELAAQGYDALVAPLLRVEFAQSSPELGGVRTLIFTSRNGVAAFIARSSERSFETFAVGDATALAARRAGFQQVWSASGDVVSLRQLVLRQARRASGRLMRVGAVEPAGSLVADLVAGGFEVSDWPAYRTVEICRQQVLDQIGAPERTIDAALVYSPKAARHLATLLDNNPHVLRRIICISPAAAAPLQTHAAHLVRVAEEPNEASLFAALRAVLV